MYPAFWGQTGRLPRETTQLNGMPSTQKKVSKGDAAEAIKEVLPLCLSGAK